MANRVGSSDLILEYVPKEKITAGENYFVVRDEGHQGDVCSILGCASWADGELFWVDDEGNRIALDRVIRAYRLPCHLK